MDKELPTQTLLKLLNQPVWILCKNEREFSGVFKGLDVYTNVILQDCTEYEKLPDKNFRQTKHKTILISGNTIDMIVKGEKPAL